MSRSPLTFTRSRRKHHMLSHRLLACAATLACATLSLVVPAAQAYTLTNTPRVTTSSSAALPASSDTPELNAATAAQAHHEAFASSSLTRTRSNTATSSGSTITTFEALVLIAIITIIFCPRPSSTSSFIGRRARTSAICLTTPASTARSTE